MSLQDRDSSPDPHDAASLAKVSGRAALRGPLAGADGSTQAFQELAKGEQTAAALEKQLTAMEARIEILLARTEEQQRLTQPPSGSANNSSHTGPSSGQSQEKPSGACK